MEAWTYTFSAGEVYREHKAEDGDHACPSCEDQRVRNPEKDTEVLRWKGDTIASKRGISGRS